MKIQSSQNSQKSYRQQKNIIDVTSLPLSLAIVLIDHKVDDQRNENTQDTHQNLVISPQGTQCVPEIVRHQCTKNSEQGVTGQTLVNGIDSSQPEETHAVLRPHGCKVDQHNENQHNKDFETATSNLHQLQYRNADEKSTHRISAMIEEHAQRTARFYLNQILLVFLACLPSKLSKF